jgi:hypothetical protein
MLNLVFLQKMPTVQPGRIADTAERLVGAPITSYNERGPSEESCPLWEALGLRERERVPFERP